MKLIGELFKFLFYSGLIVVICKYILVPVIRNLAESLKLKSKTVGNITGISTSVPELLTVAFSAAGGLANTSIYNILSSNVINLTQYIFSIYSNKNQKILKNRALKIDLIMSIITIIIPILFLWSNISFSINIVPILILLFLLIIYINHQTHKMFLNIHKGEENNIKWHRKTKVIVKYSIYLVIISISLFIIGNLLSQVLENLCNEFNVPEMIIGVLLGFITSIPEIITFFESQKHHDLEENKKKGVIEATNNLLISNCLNLFIIQTIGILIFYIFGNN